ncbi:Phage terminase, small subunit [Bacillus sp. OV166]|uniref:terminase small subunit n=1 Tax=Bacillus sp. OV166 TaxID=1882763 RepID=UPI000A2AA476|nr:terminase small subunit [Bacillus sp. OV166]SMQ86833.1 Phage terminase, small subunit [Bacillus sp. OV166]
MKTFDSLTDKQKKFVEIYIEISNGHKAAVIAGYAEIGASQEAYRLLRNPRVKEYIDELEKERRERIQNRLAAMVEQAVKKMFELATTAESESVRLAAIKDILDRAGYKATNKVEQKNEHIGKITFGFCDPGEE